MFLPTSYIFTSVSNLTLFFTMKPAPPKLPFTHALFALNQLNPLLISTYSLPLRPVLLIAYTSHMLLIIQFSISHCFVLVPIFFFTFFHTIVMYVLTCSFTCGVARHPGLIWLFLASSTDIPASPPVSLLSNDLALKNVAKICCTFKSCYIL